MTLITLHMVFKLLNFNKQKKFNKIVAQRELFFVVFWFQAQVQSINAAKTREGIYKQNY